MSLSLFRGRRRRKELERGRWFGLDLLDLLVDEEEVGGVALPELLPDLLRLDEEGERLLGLVQIRQVELTEEEEQAWRGTTAARQRRRSSTPGRNLFRARSFSPCEE